MQNDRGEWLTIQHTKEELEEGLRALQAKRLQHLFVGSIVHYVHHLGDGRYKDVAAIVTDVYDKETGNINVREMDFLHLRSCLYSETREGGTWHWPERA